MCQKKKNCKRHHVKSPDDNDCMLSLNLSIYIHNAFVHLEANGNDDIHTYIDTYIQPGVVVSIVC